MTNLFGTHVDVMLMGLTALFRAAAFVTLAVILWDLVQATRWNGHVVKALVLLIASLVVLVVWTMIPDVVRLTTTDVRAVVVADQSTDLLGFIPYALVCIAAVLFRLAVNRKKRLQDQPKRRWNDR